MFHTDVLFTGFYGQSNTGDDAFVEVAAWGARKFWGKTNIRFLAKSGKLPSTVVDSKGYPLSVPKTYRYQSEILLKRSSAFVYAGGSTIHSRISEDSIRLKAFKRKVKNRELQIGGIGVSIGPFKTVDDEKAVINYLQQMDFLAVRDQRSFDFVENLKLPYRPINAFDLAALLPDIYSFKKSVRLGGTRKIIGVSICPYESLQANLDPKNEQKRNDRMVELLMELNKTENIHFRFYVINGNINIGDRYLTLETIARVAPTSYELVEYNRSTRSTWESIADCDFMISTRLHAAIFACFGEVPFLLNEYHPKCADFLENVGYNEDYRVFNSDFSIKNKCRQILDIISGNAQYERPKALTEMLSRARLNFTQIHF